MIGEGLAELALELAGGEGDGDEGHEGEDGSVDPDIREAGSAEEDSASNIDVVSGRNDLAYVLEVYRHVVDREDISRKKDRR